MQKPGFEAISRAITPYFQYVPDLIHPPLDELDDEGEEYSHRHIEITQGESYRHHEVITILDNAGLLEGSPQRDKQTPDMPILRIAGILPHGILFEDLNHQP